MVEGNQPADDRFFPDGKSNAMAVLQREARLFVGEAEVLCLGPNRSNLRRGAAGAHQFDGSVQIIAAAFVSVDHGMRRVADGEATVVASAVSHVRMEDVVVDGISRAEHAIGENMRMRVATLT